MSETVNSDYVLQLGVLYNVSKTSSAPPPVGAVVQIELVHIERERSSRPPKTNKTKSRCRGIKRRNPPKFLRAAGYR